MQVKEIERERGTLLIRARICSRNGTRNSYKLVRQNYKQYIIHTHTLFWSCRRENQSELVSREQSVKCETIQKQKFRNLKPP